MISDCIAPKLEESVLNVMFSKGADDIYEVSGPIPLAIVC